MKLLSIMMILSLLIPAVGLAADHHQDYENLTHDDANALSGDGWLFYGNVFDSGGGFLYGHGPWPCPNAQGNVCDIAQGEGGAIQGAQQFNMYSDYNSAEHGNGNLVETNVFQEQIIDAGHVGTYTFQFDGKRGNLTGASTAAAYIKTLDPGNGYAMTNYITQDMTTEPTTWDTYTLTIDIDAGMIGQILQFGFTTTATNYEASGVFYDNVWFTNDPSSPTAQSSWGSLKSLFR